MSTLDAHPTIMDPHRQNGGRWRVVTLRGRSKQVMRTRVCNWSPDTAHIRVLCPFGAFCIRRSNSRISRYCTDFNGTSSRCSQRCSCTGGAAASYSTVRQCHAWGRRVTQVQRWLQIPITWRFSNSIRTPRCRCCERGNSKIASPRRTSLMFAAFAAPSRDYSAAFSSVVSCDVTDPMQSDVAAYRSL